MTGFICLDKPEGITSFGAVGNIRRLTGERKAGHTGTLDPLATGALPIALGGATRLIGFLPDLRKSYEARFVLGLRTDTLDITGAVLNEETPHADIGDIEALLCRFSGDILQTPPMFSAKKLDGVRLYDLARQGVEVERKAVPITVYKIEAGVTDKENTYTLSVSCSAGTYIRSIISDIGEALGCGATMTSLRRTGACGFDISQAHTVNALSELKDAGNIESALVPADKPFSVYPSVTVTDAQAVRFSNGGELFKDRLPDLREDGMHRVYSPEGLFLGLGKAQADSELLSVKRVFKEC